MVAHYFEALVSAAGTLDGVLSVLQGKPPKAVPLRDGSVKPVFVLRSSEKLEVHRNGDKSFTVKGEGTLQTIRDILTKQAPRGIVVINGPKACAADVYVIFPSQGTIHTQIKNTKDKLTI
jgi:hypothetical protein